MSGALQPLWDYLAKEDRVVDGEKDRKQSDLALARLLSTDDFAGAIKAASFEDLDRALAHDALAVERKPLSCLFLLSTKSSKVEQVAKRSDDAGAHRVAVQRLILQVSQFLYQVPVYVMIKEMKRVSQVAAHYAMLALALGQPIKAVFPLKSLLRRFHQHGHAVVTPLHAHFYYLCLQAKCYSAATEILHQPLVEVYSEQKVVTAVDFLGYAYYGGVLCLGQKQYQLAIEYLLSAVTAPAIALSAFVVEAYKKLVLASLIWHGETPTLPKYTPFVVTRHLEMHCSAYVDLGRAFMVEKDLEKVALVAQTHAGLFAKDGNFGLVKQVIEARKQRKLLQLPRTYVTIALSEMTKAVGMENHGDVAAEKLLLELIARGDMAAVVDKQKQMVTFVLDDDATSSAESELEQMRVMEKLQHEMEKILYVSAQLRAMDSDIVTSAKFQHRLQKEKERRQQRAGHGGAPGPAPDERMFPDAMD